MQSRLLHEPDDVAICVFYRGNQPPSADILDLLECFCPGTQERLQTLLDVINLPVGDRSGHPLAVAMGIKTCIQAPHAEANMVRLIQRRIYAPERAIKLFCLRNVFDGMDDCLHTFAHEELLLLVILRIVASELPPPVPPPEVVPGSAVPNRAASSDFDGISRYHRCIAHPC